jgi:hypothetical protein
VRIDAGAGLLGEHDLGGAGSILVNGGVATTSTYMFTQLGALFPQVSQTASINGTPTTEAGRHRCSR